MDKNAEIDPSAIKKAVKVLDEPEEPVGSPHACTDEDIN